MIQTRTFDRLCHEILDIPLNRIGFAWVGGGVYVRRTPEGRDSIGFDIRPSRSRFCVLIGYAPKEFEIVEALHPELTEADLGFLCRPYLNPVGTSWKPRWWNCTTKEIAMQSLHHVLECVESAGERWLSALRDPEFLAANSDSVAALSSGFAYELAGDLDIARQRYLAMNRRYSEIEKTTGIRKFRDGWRAFIFVRAKLGVEDELTADVRALAGWNPRIPRLGEGR